MRIRSPLNWEKTERRGRRPRISLPMKRTSRLTRTTKFCSTSSLRLAVENGVQWPQLLRNVPLDPCNPTWRDQQVWIWVWEKEKPKELKRRITHSPRDCLINKLYLRRKISTAIGLLTWDTKDWLERCLEVKRVAYSADRVWEDKRQVVTVCRIFQGVNKFQNKWCKNKCNNILWVPKLINKMMVKKSKKMRHSKFNRSRSKTMVSKIRSLLLLMKMARTERNATN
jgi:hypothetical protein